MTLTKEHCIIARHKTADGIEICVWSDGDVTSRMGQWWPGVRAKKGDIPLSLLIAHEACLFTNAEMPALIRAAKKCAKKAKGMPLPGDVRTMAAKLVEQMS